ncbi:hypothetical protein GGE12_005345 [Rhizobium mongolense]|uniref:Uncharacterized protein n=1 Tax=Rhizobium mongolense TaxID=57676 RepID=A0A7W6WHB3_9HYPH|nr:hypothetical protein [Rhizobium mongolense]
MTARYFLSLATFPDSSSGPIDSNAVSFYGVVSLCVLMPWGW